MRSTWLIWLVTWQRLCVMKSWYWLAGNVARIAKTLHTRFGFVCVRMAMFTFRISGQLVCFVYSVVRSMLCSLRLTTTEGKHGMVSNELHLIYSEYKKRMAND